MDLSLAVDRRRFLSLAAGSLAMAPFVPTFADEPSRLIVHTDVPKNAEPRLPVLAENWLTPTEQFYIRSHAPNPRIDADGFRLTVTGLVERELSISLDELAAYDQTSVVATMTCAGNRRYEHSKVSPIEGVPWREGAIGNAQWSGVRLSEILMRAGLNGNAKHVWFEGLDEIERSGGIIPFGASIPVEKAMSDTEIMPGALVCTKMNREPLTPDHGWPVRTVVPGYIGARSVKWLGKITVSDRPSPNHYVATAYKLVTEGSDLEWAEQGPIYRFPINAVICTPTAGSKLKPGTITVSGYALPPGDGASRMARVRVSADGGQSWTNAALTSDSRPFCWQLWTAEVKIGPSTNELIVQAIDSNGRRQPRRVDWNLKGYLFNAWHRVPISVSG